MPTRTTSSKNRVSVPLTGKEIEELGIAAIHASRHLAPGEPRFTAATLAAKLIGQGLARLFPVGDSEAASTQAHVTPPSNNRPIAADLHVPTEYPIRRAVLQECTEATLKFLRDNIESKRPFARADLLAVVRFTVPHIPESSFDSVLSNMRRRGQVALHPDVTKKYHYHLPEWVRK